MNKIYNDWIDVNDTLVFPPFMLGSEGQYGTLFDTDSGVLSPLGTSWVLNFLLNSTSTNYDGANNFDYSTVQLTDVINPGDANADDFDLLRSHPGVGS